MPSHEVIRVFGKKLRELIFFNDTATTEMQTLVLRLALLEAARRSDPGVVINCADTKTLLASQ